MTSDERAERLARAVEAFLVSRYPTNDLVELFSAGGMQEHERQLAQNLFHWQQDDDWPSPEIIGESRCANCHVLMGDESSVFDDETICAKCGPGDDAVIENHCELCGEYESECTCGSARPATEGETP